jgi:hypothetical protein
MGTEYSAGVFFGACVPRRSALGEKLDEYIDKQGGTPAETEIEGVVIGMVGSQSTGQIWIVVQAKGSARSFGRNEGECPEPSLLTEIVGWRLAIRALLTKLGAPDLPIEWHFQGSVW